MALAAIVNRVQRSDAAVALTPGGVHVEWNDPPEAVAKSVAVDGHVRPHVVVLGAPTRAREVIDDFRNVQHVVGSGATLGKISGLARRKVGLVDGTNKVLIVSMVGEWRW